MNCWFSFVVQWYGDNEEIPHRLFIYLFSKYINLIGKSSLFHSIKSCQCCPFHITSYKFDSLLGITCRQPFFFNLKTTNNSHLGNNISTLHVSLSIRKFLNLRHWVQFVTLQGLGVFKRVKNENCMFIASLDYPFKEVFKSKWYKYLDHIPKLCKMSKLKISN